MLVYQRVFFNKSLVAYNRAMVDDFHFDAFWAVSRDLFGSVSPAWNNWNGDRPPTMVGNNSSRNNSSIIPYICVSPPKSPTYVFRQPLFKWDSLKQIVLTHIIHYPNLGSLSWFTDFWHQLIVLPKNWELQSFNDLEYLQRYTYQVQTNSF
jgi:hypothetical protein